jgi:hypothetical protein
MLLRCSANLAAERSLSFGIKSELKESYFGIDLCIDFDKLTRVIQLVDKPFTYDVELLQHFWVFLSYSVCFGSLFADSTP